MAPIHPLVPADELEIQFAHKLHLIDACQSVIEA